MGVNIPEVVLERIEILVRYRAIEENSKIKLNGKKMSIDERGFNVFFFLDEVDFEVITMKKKER